MILTSANGVLNTTKASTNAGHQVAESSNSDIVKPSEQRLSGPTRALVVLAATAVGVDRGFCRQRGLRVDNFSVVLNYGRRSFSDLNVAQSGAVPTGSRCT